MKLSKKKKKKIFLTATTTIFVLLVALLDLDNHRLSQQPKENNSEQSPAGKPASPITEPKVVKNQAPDNSSPEAKTSPSVVASTSEQAIVVKIVDGDTVKLDNGKTLRYIGIDTPETKHPRKPQECFGQEATAKNKELVEGKTVTLVKDVNNTDRYGRLLRYVYVDNLFINEELVKQGYAFSTGYPPDIAKQNQLNEAEKFARENKLGLWADDACPIQ